MRQEPPSWTDGTLFLNLYLQSISSGLGMRADGQRGLSDSAVNAEEIGQGSSGGPLTEPSKHLFIKANVSSPLGTRRLLSTYCFSQTLCLCLTSSKGQHPSSSHRALFSLLCSLLKALAPPPAALPELPPTSVDIYLPGHPGMPPTP